MWEPLQRYSALPLEARKLFRRAAFLGPVIGVSLRFRGYAKTQGWLQSRLDRQTIQYSETPEIPSRIETTCRMVRAAEHYSLVRVTCLEESLVLWYLLQNQGIFATIRIGVRKLAGKFEAHAWVERNGSALNQTDEQHLHYRAFDTDGSIPPTEQP
jgi:Transglutaminase-like superfamily